MKSVNLHVAQIYKPTGACQQPTSKSSGNQNRTQVGTDSTFDTISMKSGTKRKLETTSNQ